MIKLHRFSNVLRFHSLGQVFVCAVRWVRAVRGTAPQLGLNSTLNFSGNNEFLKPAGKN